MKRLLTLFVLIVAVVFSYSAIAQEMGSLRKAFQFTTPEKIQGPLGDPIPAGTYSIGTAGDFPTIDSAFNKLSIDGIAGEVTLELIDVLYTAPTDTFGFLLNGPIPGAGTNSRVTIKPAENTNVTIEGNQLVVLSFINTSYMTVDGVSLTGPSTLTVHAILNTQFPVNDAIDFIDDSDNNIIQNTIFIVEDYTGFSAGILFLGLSNSSGAPDNNIIQNNHIKQSSFAIVIVALNSNINAINNIISGNIVGSESDTLISWGIQIEENQNTVIENNIVQNVHSYNPDFFYAIGINSYWCTGCVTRNNVVRNVSSNSPGGSVGILLSGVTGNIGNDNLIYNNMVYDIQSTSTQFDSRVAGIQLWMQNNPKIYYNSVYLSGNGANRQGSAALYIYGGFGNSTNVEVKNNIFVNTRDESPYWASSIYDYSVSNLTSDYNDLFYASNQNSGAVRIGSTIYSTLADWQVTGNDINSITEMPNFIVPDLHINPNIATNIESGATPIAGIDTDFDGKDRNVSTPDIGADEFNGTIIPVELISFTANVNNEGNVVLKWSTATELNNQMFEIERRSNNGQFTTIGYVEGYGTTTEPQGYSYIDNSVEIGMYFYRLKQIDFSGQYEYSDEIEVEVNGPLTFALERNYPNPFNPSTLIKYSVPDNGFVKLSVYNLVGEEVNVLVNETVDAGFYEVTFNATNLPSGTYFYRLQASNTIQIKKMILLK